MKRLIQICLQHGNFAEPSHESGCIAIHSDIVYIDGTWSIEVEHVPANLAAVKEALGY